MPAVDRDAMPAAQRAAWDRLWRILLTPETEEPRAGTSLAATTDAGQTVDTSEAATGRHDTMNRGGKNV